MIACFNVGFYCEHGIGTQKDYVKAGEFYKKACDADYDNACINLASIHTTSFADGEHNKSAFEIINKTCKKRQCHGLL